MTLNSGNKISIFRLISLILGVYLLMILSGKISILMVFALVFISIVYAFWREYIWILLILAIPGLIFGEILDLPITEGWTYEARVAEAFLMLAAAVFFLDLYLRNNFKKLKFDKVSFILFCFTALFIVSFVYVSDFRLYVFGLKVVVFSFLAYLMAINLLDTQTKINYFFYFLTVTAIILSGQVLYEFYEMGFSTKFFFERNSILIPIGPVALTSAILAFMAPIMLGLYYNENRGKGEGLYYYLAVALCVLAVFLTLGKGAILSMMAGMAVIFFNTKNKIPFLLFGSWFILIGVILLNPFFSGLLERLKTTFVDKNTDFRILEYKTGWELFKTSPVYGVGAGQQLLHFPRMMNMDNAHFVNNYIFQAMIDLGVIGLALVLTLTKDIFLSVRGYMKRFGYRSMVAVSFTGAFLCAFLNGMVEVTFFALPYAIIFWLVAGVYFNNMKLLEKRFPVVEYSKPEVI